MHNEYLTTMPIELDTKLTDLLKDFDANDYYLTGSRAIGGSSRGSDYDIVMIGTDKVRECLYRCGFFCESNKYNRKAGTNWESYRWRKINVILVEDRKTLAKWALSTELAKGLRLYDKDIRVALFDGITDETFFSESEGQKASAVDKGLAA
jgi:hypothetical protein